MPNKVEMTLPFINGPLAIINFTQSETDFNIFNITFNSLAHRDCKIIQITKILYDIHEEKHLQGGLQYRFD